ncbi:MAG: polynucleotide adenylyltransferase PcnB [Gammaproteobacteria bacterium]|nr:polynucleotide adenylyltransferase PcnB [Gammaproteobacteria bacterium]
MAEPKRIPRNEHCISRDNIDDNALKVLYRLQHAGFRALLVGGGVRDLLLNHVPKDFDIATDAHPEQIKKLFGNCWLIGRRFRLAHIFYGREIIEVATFRAGHDEADDDGRHDDSGRILRDNVYGNIEGDVWRRDFTVNALYYDIADFSVVDYVGAMADIENRVLRLIGDPETRYREDPVRMLRAVRFAAKLGFTIHPDSLAPIQQLGHLLEDIPPSRLYEEILKLFHSGQAVRGLELLRQYNLFGYLFPATEKVLQSGDPVFTRFLTAALESTDKRINEGKPITPAFLFAAMLWQPMQLQAEIYKQTEETTSLAMQKAIASVLGDQIRAISIPRRFSTVVRDIWYLQHRFNNRHGRRARALLEHNKFRAAYDFMCLRSKAGEITDDSCEWWTNIQGMTFEQQERLLSPGKKSPRKRSKKKPKSD